MKFLFLQLDLGGGTPMWRISFTKFLAFIIIKNKKLFFSYKIDDYGYIFMNILNKLKKKYLNIKNKRRILSYQSLK
jgi:hypothetical protein